LGEGRMKVKRMYPEIESFEDLLEDADSNAGNDWEMEFVSGINEKYEQYGAEMFLSEKQREILERIGRGE